MNSRIVRKCASKYSHWQVPSVWPSRVVWWMRLNYGIYVFNGTYFQGHMSGLPYHWHRPMLRLMVEDHLCVRGQVLHHHLHQHKKVPMIIHNRLIIRYVWEIRAVVTLTSSGSCSSSFAQSIRAAFIRARNEDLLRAVHPTSTNRSIV